MPFVLLGLTILFSQNEQGLYIWEGVRHACRFYA
mgnify:CR=1 FL=1